jgi:hypothetical protein
MSFLQLNESNCVPDLQVRVNVRKNHKQVDYVVVPGSFGVFIIEVRHGKRVNIGHIHHTYEVCTKMAV